MPSEIGVNKDVEIIEVRTYGDVSFEDLQGQISETIRIAEETGIRKVLVDTTGEKSLPSAFDMLDFISKLPRSLVYATYSRPEQATLKDMKFAENVALNRVIIMRHFVDRITALAWLLAQPYPREEPIEQVEPHK